MSPNPPAAPWLIDPWAAKPSQQARGGSAIEQLRPTPSSVSARVAQAPLSAAVPFFWGCCVLSPDNTLPAKRLPPLVGIRMMHPNVKRERASEHSQPACHAPNHPSYCFPRNNPLCCLPFLPSPPETSPLAARPQEASTASPIRGQGRTVRGLLFCFRRACLVMRNLFYGYCTPREGARQLRINSGESAGTRKSGKIPAVMFRPPFLERRCNAVKWERNTRKIDTND